MGLGGLDGQGQRQLLLALFGTLIGVTGTIEIDGKTVKLSSPGRAKSEGIGMALIPEDRKNEGLMLPMSVRDNLSFASIEGFSRFGIIDRKAEAAAIDDMIKLLNIRVGDIDGPVASLSGGNQQKVVIAKWLMTKPRIILLNDPTRGIDVGTKQELYELLRRLAEGGAAILFYSTDYDELIGCCDRVLVFYNGAITRTLEGAALTEHNLIASAHNLPTSAEAEVDASICHGGRVMSDESEASGNGRRSWEAWGHWFTAQRGLLISVAIFAAMFAFYGWKQEVGLSASMVNTAANKGALLALVAMAQTIPVLTGGLDLSVGMVFVLSNCLAASVVTGDARMTALGIILVLITGLVCGIINGLIVVYGRLQPIIVTLATGAVFFGVALALRPEPGGSVNFELAEFMTSSIFKVPVSLILLRRWCCLSGFPIGARCLAVRPMPSVRPNTPPICRVCRSRGQKFLPMHSSGFLAAIAGLMLTFLTYSGAAKASLGGDYTLNSIAAVVIGGTSLFGGAGSAIGSIFGAFVMRTVGDLLIVFDINPVLQPLVRRHRASVCGQPRLAQAAPHQEQARSLSVGEGRQWQRW